MLVKGATGNDTDLEDTFLEERILMFILKTIS